MTNILSDPATAMWGPIIANVWFGIPFFAITLLAALKSIPSELYEAAAIDGASPWQQFTKVTLPFLAPTIAITVMLRTIWIATFADLIYRHDARAARPARPTPSPVYIYVSAFKSLDKGYASAVAVLLLVLLIVYAIVADRHPPLAREACLMIAGRSTSSRIFGGIGLYAAVARLCDLRAVPDLLDAEDFGHAGAAALFRRHHAVARRRRRFENYRHRARGLRFPALFPEQRHRFGVDGS